MAAIAGPGGPFVAAMVGPGPSWIAITGPPGWDQFARERLFACPIYYWLFIAIILERKVSCENGEKRAVTLTVQTHQVDD